MDGRVRAAIERGDYYDAIDLLRAIHGLTFTHNPGGGEFSCRRVPGWRCQVGCQDDRDDYEHLATAVATAMSLL